jgi:DNA-binding HxlR family transcriptional regulator
MAVMSSGLASLHKILKDETRRKTILLLSERGAISYTDLMEELGIVSTGMLNYHLKVLSDLLTKNEAGQYALTEKGTLASKLLTEFPDENSQLKKKKLQRRFWTAVGVSHIIILITVWTLHSTGYMDFARAVQSSVAAISGVALAYLGNRMLSTRPEPGSSKEKSRMRIGYTLGGAWLGLVASTFGILFLTVVSTRLGGPNFRRIIDEPWEFLFLLLSLAIIGGVGGYYLGKRNGFSKPKWMTWIDEKFGF